VHYSYYAVFDGHGGKQVADRCAQVLLDQFILPALDAQALEASDFSEILNAEDRHELDKWWLHNVPLALKNAFLQADRCDPVRVPVQ
jgi:serine/threonine protein phosphatase PrpC